MSMKDLIILVKVDIFLLTFVQSIWLETEIRDLNKLELL